MLLLRPSSASTRMPSVSARTTVRRVRPLSSPTAVRRVYVPSRCACALRRIVCGNQICFLYRVVGRGEISGYEPTAQDKPDKIGNWHFDMTPLTE